MTATLVRYRVTPEHVEENADLVAGVYAELAMVRPRGFEYQTWVAEDGVTFIHLAVNEREGATPLTSLVAFRRFQAGLRDRCDEPPVLTTMPRRIAAYVL